MVKEQYRETDVIRKMYFYFSIKIYIWLFKNYKSLFCSIFLEPELALELKVHNKYNNNLIFKW